MWIRNQEGEPINLDHYGKIYIHKCNDGKTFRALAEDGELDDLLAEFNSEEECQKYIDKLFKDLKRFESR